MSRATVADMLADLLCAGPTPAKPAKPAKSGDSIDSAADNGTSEGLRISAKASSDSQVFAGIRNTTSPPESEHSCGSSHDSQLSQGLPEAIASPEVKARPATEESSGRTVRARAHARGAMHRLGYADADAEAQLEAVLQTVPAATVAADLQAIGDERGLPPATDPAQERHAEQLLRRDLPPAVVARLAPQLAQRDRDEVDLRACAECASFGPTAASRAQVVWYCCHPSALVKYGYPGPDVLFRCEGFLRVG